MFAKTFFSEDDILHQRWANYPRHPLQQEEPDGDREWIEHHQALQKLTKFEDSIGVEFTHIRLLARAFTDRSLGYNNLSQYAKTLIPSTLLHCYLKILIVFPWTVLCLEDLIRD